jgi:hypothetical protein
VMEVCLSTSEEGEGRGDMAVHGESGYTSSVTRRIQSCPLVSLFNEPERGVWLEQIGLPLV